MKGGLKQQMKFNQYTFQVILASIISFITWFIGEIDVYIYVLALFILIDYITGIMKSILERKLSSQIGGCEGSLV